MFSCVNCHGFVGVFLIETLSRKGKHLGQENKKGYVDCKAVTNVVSGNTDKNVTRTVLS